MDTITTEHSFVSKATYGIYMLVLFFINILSKGVCTIMHWQTSGRLVQELNICTVGILSGVFEASLTVYFMSFLHLSGLSIMKQTSISWMTHSVHSVLEQHITSLTGNTIAPNVSSNENAQFITRD